MIIELMKMLLMLKWIKPFFLLQNSKWLFFVDVYILFIFNVHSHVTGNVFDVTLVSGKYWHEIICFWYIHYSYLLESLTIKYMYTKQQQKYVMIWHQTLIHMLSVYNPKGHFVYRCMYEIKNVSESIKHTKKPTKMIAKTHIYISRKRET
jgi:hypothetical protein